MPDPFPTLIAEARAFLAELGAQNNRDWFNAQKSRYEAHLKTPATLLLEQVAHDLGRDWDMTLTPKLFRPQRDVRFSKDKTPYHTHLHMMWTLSEGNKPALFFGIAPGYVTVGGGVMGFDKPALLRWREAVGGAEGDGIAAELERLAEVGFAPHEPQLKRVPAPYPKDHPRADLLRHKGLAVWSALPEAQWPTPLSATKQEFGQLRELMTVLADI